MSTLFHALIVGLLIAVIVYYASASYLEKRKALAEKYKDNLFVKMRIGLSQIFVKLAELTFHEQQSPG